VEEVVEGVEVVEVVVVVYFFVFVLVSVFGFRVSFFFFRSPN